VSNVQASVSAYNSHSSVAVVYSHIHTTVTTYYSDIATIRNIVQVY